MTVYFADEWMTLHVGNTLDVLAELPAASVDCCVTSPPYWGLRDYEGHPDQIGLEDTPEEYVEKLTAIFVAVKRVLTPDGTLWLNLGDSYANDEKWGGSTGGKHVTALHGATGVGRRKQKAGLGPKNLVGAPWRVALALQAAGWTLRNAIIWHKPNAMPSPVQDRLTNVYEQVFLLTPNPRYWFDLDPIREALAYPEDRDGTKIIGGKHKGTAGGVGATARMRGSSAYGATAYPEGMNPQANMGATGSRHVGRGDEEKGKNPGDVWGICTRPFPKAHFATFPIDLPLRCIKAGCKPGGVVLDVFSGAGTTGVAARDLGRRYVGIDLVPEYHELTKARLAQGALDLGDIGLSSRSGDEGQPGPEMSEEIA